MVGSTCVVRVCFTIVSNCLIDTRSRVGSGIGHDSGVPGSLIGNNGCVGLVDGNVSRCLILSSTVVLILSSIA